MASREPESPRLGPGGLTARREARPPRIVQGDRAAIRSTIADIASHGEGCDRVEPLDPHLSPRPRNRANEATVMPIVSITWATSGLDRLDLSLPC